MKTVFFCLIQACLLSFASFAQAKGQISVMTLNQYLGADLAPIISTVDPGAFNQGLVAVLTQTAKSDFRARARAQARAIASRLPDVLALQEVWELRCQDFDGNPTTGCEDPQIADAFTDHLALTLAALKKKGVKYKKVALVKNLDLEKINVLGAPVAGLPFVIHDVPAFLVAVDRDAILVRERITAQPVVLPQALCANPSIDGCNYQIAAEAITPAGPLRIERGFIAIDANIAGKDYRIFNTHLEVKGEDLKPPLPLFTAFQAAQADELIRTIGFLATADKKTLLLGDMNSSPDQQSPAPGIVTPYQQFAAANYLDIWTLRPGDLPGYTCCQDENLLNRKPSLEERIDMILSVDNPENAKKIRVIGDNASTKATSHGLRLWFSDHAAVAAKLQF
ncbi:MAG: endonuclease/exonuclease/phosphatase family protein [Methylomicrobium sp.]